MGFFDTLLTAIAPERAVKRVAAQTAIRAINSGYSNYGASLHKKSMRGWMWHGGSPKEDIEDNLRVLRERSRDAYMGVPLATGAIKTMRTNVVCGGLTPTPQIDNAFLGISDEEAQKINEQIAREFALWANKPTCDADRIDNFYMLQQLAFTGFLLNGDSWAVLQNKKTPGVPYDLRVRIIEADRICSPAFMDILSPTDINEHHVEKIVQGVETDADGMVIAYWVCDRHPLASTSVTGLTASHWTRVEAYGKKTGRQNVLCLMQRERAGQLRGVPLLAPVLESLKQLGRFTDAELTAAVISAMFTVFIKKSDQSDEVPFGEMLPPDVQVDTPDKTSVELAPGAFIDLNPGEEVQFADPKHPTTGFEAFMNAIVKQMAAALEIPSEVLYKQFSTSYSAARGALNEFWRTTGMHRDWFADSFCQPVYEMFLAEAVALGRINAPGFFTDPLVREAWCGARWIGPVQGSLDPKKEAEAALMLIDNAIKTHEQVSREMSGGDWEENVEQLQRENELLTQAGGNKVTVVSASPKVTAMKTNFEHLQSLNVRSMALAIWNYASDYCAYCPKNMERRCNENCRAGIREWLNSPYIPSSDIWKEKR